MPSTSAARESSAELSSGIVAAVSGMGVVTIMGSEWLMRGSLWAAVLEKSLRGADGKGSFFGAVGRSSLVNSRSGSFL